MEKVISSVKKIIILPKKLLGIEISLLKAFVFSARRPCA